MKQILIIIFFCITSLVSFSQEQTMYWIGGAGNWDDLSHWSLQSGSQGTVLPSSIPNANTNVIFNAASGLSLINGQSTSSINVRLGGAIVKTLTFADDLTETNSPRFYGSQTLTVRGDILLKPNVVFDNANLISSPNTGEIANVFFNQNPLNRFQKDGAGQTNITEVFPLNIDLSVLNGLLEYQPATIQINDLRLLGKFSLPNVTTFNLRNLTDRNSPLLDSELILPANATINANDWYFRGVFNVPNSVLNITGSVFYTTSDSDFYKVNFNSNNLTLTCIGTVDFEEVSFQNKNLTMTEDSYISSEKYLLAPGIKVSMGNRAKIEVKQDIDLFPSQCGELAFISSAGVATAFFLNSTGSDLILDKIVFNFIAFPNTTNETSITEGAGNSGNYTFITPSRVNFYWVGNGTTSDWNDPLNWSNTPNGPSGTCLPSILDDVFIDTDSTLDIIINNENAQVHNITINAPQFSVSGLEVLVSGSWEMSSNSVINSRIVFKTDSLEKTITSNTSVFSSLYFDGRGSWVFQDNLKTINNGSIELAAGTIDTNEKNVFLDGNFNGELRLAGGISRTLIMEKSEFSVNNIFGFSATHHSCFLYADELGSHIILRNGTKFSVNSVQIDKVTVYDQSPNNTNTLVLTYGNLTEITEFTIYAKTTNFLYNTPSAFYWNRILSVDNFKIIPIQGSPVLNIWTDLTVRDFEVGPLAAIFFKANKNFSILGDFISNTIDCSGLMRFDVSNKAPGEFFNFTSQNDIFISNVFLNGVKAADNGVAYQMTGAIGEDTSGFTVVSQPSKDLYWIGISSDNWNDKLNWTTDSTGSPSQDACVPTQYDNVYFESFSGNGVGGLNINITNTPAYFKNFYAINAPENMVFNDLAMNGYGDVVQFGENSIFNLSFNHYGSNAAMETTFSSPDSYPITLKYLRLISFNPNYVFQFENTLAINENLTLGGGIVNLNASSYEIRYIVQNNNTILNIAESLTVSFCYNFTSGRINANGANLYFQNFESNSYDSAFLDITNANLTLGNYFRFTGPNANIAAQGSRISVYGNFYSNQNHHFNIIEVPVSRSINFYANNSTFNQLIMNGNTTIVNDLNVGELFLAPKNLVLNIQPSVNLNITEDMDINGTPCQFNTIQGGVTVNSNISYLNPYSENIYDFVNIKNINATDADLIFDVNSTVQESNNKVIKLDGPTGVIGLGGNRLCEASYILSATDFYGNDLSIYKWYKKDESGVFIQLNVPEDAEYIDVSEFGYNGTYKVEIVYDNTIPIANQCRSDDEISITFAPIEVGFETNPVVFCVNSSPTLADVSLDATTNQYIEDTDAVLNWYNSATGGTQIPLTTPLVENITYYASLSNGVSCESEVRKPLTVVFNQIPIANAGPNQTGVTGQTFVMQANNPLIGIGRWIVLSGDVYITDSASYNTTVTLVSGEIAELQWEVNNNGCIVTDDLIIGELPYTPMINPSNRIRVSK